jgi:glutaminyl-tRNA synthetase
VRDFCDRIGVAKRNSTVDIALLEHCIREDLNRRTSRVMAVLRPLKVVITNYPEDKVEWMTTENNVEQPEMGTREIPFAREIYIEQEDFMEDPPKKFFRLQPGGEVRLKSAYIIQCQEVIKDDQGRIVEVHCTYDPDSKSGGPNAGRRIKGTLHWVSAQHALPAEIRLYDQLFLKENPDEEEEGADFTSFINPDSLEVLTESLVEPSLASAPMESSYQFLRQGYFAVDPDSSSGKLVFNRVVGLRDSWAKIQSKQG